MAPKKRSSGGSQYKTIDGVKYEKDLLEMAEEFVKDGQISDPEAKQLWEAAMDGNKITPTEKRTLEYIMEKMKHTEKAKTWMAEQLKGLSASQVAEDEPKAEEPAPKKARTEDAGADEADGKKSGDAKKEKEAPKQEELEVDAADDKRPRVKSPVVLSNVDCTMDVTVSHEGAVTSSLSSNGFHWLSSGVRATAGAKAGRYYFDVKVLEKKQGEEFLRLGYSTQKSTFFLGDNSCDGTFFEASHKWGHNPVGVLLNLEESSPNAFTASLFVNGARAGAPKPLSDKVKEALKGGAALFPTVTFNNATIACNFGEMGGPLKPLPFKVRMFGDMSADDATLAALPKAGAKSKVVVPVGLPEEGLFDWADQFLEKNPGYEELSDRSLFNWCQKSGLKCNRNQPDSRDRPHFNFGVKEIDNRSARGGLHSMAKFTRGRNFLVIEAKANLLKEQREKLLSNTFSAPHFEKSAIVAMGEPSAEFKSWVHGEIKKRHEKKKEKHQKWQERKAAAKAKGKKEEAGKEKEDEDAAKELPEPEVGTDVWFLPKPNKQVDVTKDQVNSSYTDFSLPTKEEGFDKVSFVWAKEGGASEHLKKWQSALKATVIIKGLKPSDAFKEKLKAWQEAKKEYRKKHSEYRQKMKTDKKEEPADFIERDLSGCTDVHDCDAAGTPVYAKFENDDWVLLSWRYELHLLANFFKSDVDDPERPGVPEEHMAHYYKLYLGQEWNPKGLGKNDLAGVVDLLQDAVAITGTSTKVISPVVSADTEILKFVVATEEARRDRIRRIEAGDESCVLKIPRGGAPQSGKGAKGGDRGGDKGRGKGGGKWVQVEKPRWSGNDRGQGGQKRPSFVAPAVQPARNKFARAEQPRHGHQSGRWVPARAAPPVQHRPQSRPPWSSGGKGGGSQGGKGGGKRRW